MTASLVLEHTQEWFRENYKWKHNECGVQYNSLPAFDAGSFYVSIDDAGVSTGQQSTNSLKEIVSIKIGIWKRKNHFQKSQIGQLKMPNDKYLVNSNTLASLERKVILPKLYGLHQNWVYMNTLNRRYSLPNADRGADFTTTFYYRGRSGMLNQTLSAAGGKFIEWYGYILQFDGVGREQIIHNDSYSLG